MATNDQRSYTAGKYALDLDGKFAGWIKSVEGGYATADVIVEKVATDLIWHKHIAGVKYDDITLSCGTAMSKAFYEWLQASVDHQAKRITSGAIIAADYNFKETGRLNFFNALITEVGFPALDAASKDAASMSLKFAVETTRQLTATGSPIKGDLGTGQQKKWTPANFRLAVDGLEDACKWVNKVEALTVKQKVVDNPLGEFRDFQKEPAHIEFPNLVITVAESHADKFYQWHEDFVIKGNCDQTKEKGGSLTYLASDSKTELFTINFTGLGIFSAKSEKSESASENIKRVKFEMYAEQLTFVNKNSTFA
jgi:phage tail-like protein